MIENGTAPCMVQWEGGATYDQLWQNKDLAEVSGYVYFVMDSFFIHAICRSTGIRTL